MKKILCIADQIDPIIYDKSIAERYKDIDFILSAGDLPMEYLDFIQTALNKPLFFIFGSHYLKALTHYHPEMAEKEGKTEVFAFKKNNQFKSSKGIYLGFKKYKYDNFLIAGVSGAKKQNEGKNQFTEKQMKRKLLKLVPGLILNKIKYGRYLDILISHAPPINPQKETDISVSEELGFECLLRFIKFFKPKYLVHGQVHIYDPDKNRTSKIEQTEVVNAYSRYIIEVSDNYI